MINISKYSLIIIPYECNNMLGLLNVTKVIFDLNRYLNVFQLPFYRRCDVQWT